MTFDTGSLVLVMQCLLDNGKVDVFILLVYNNFVGGLVISFSWEEKDGET